MDSAGKFNRVCIGVGRRGVLIWLCIIEGVRLSKRCHRSLDGIWVTMGVSWICILSLVLQGEEATPLRVSWITRVGSYRAVRVNAGEIGLGILNVIGLLSVLPGGRMGLRF